MAKVPVRIALALCAAAIAIGMAVQLRAHDLFADAVAVATAPHPSTAQVDRALADLRKVSDVHPGGDAFLAAAGLNFRTRRFAAAAEAARRATENVPKPTRRTSPPPFNAPVIDSNTASTALLAAVFDRSA